MKGEEEEQERVAAGYIPICKARSYAKVGKQQEQQQPADLAGEMTRDSQGRMLTDSIFYVYVSQTGKLGRGGGWKLRHESDM